MNITFFKQLINALVIWVTSLCDLVGIQVLAHQLHLIIHCIRHLRIHTQQVLHDTTEQLPYMYYNVSHVYMRNMLSSFHVRVRNSHQTHRTKWFFKFTTQALKPGSQYDTNACAALHSIFCITLHCLHHINS